MKGWVERHPRTGGYVAIVVTLSLAIQLSDLISRFLG